MRKLLVALLMLFPLLSHSQNAWEEESEVETKANPDQKYLAGAVPLVDGKVVFTTEISAPGKSAAQIYATLKTFMLQLAKEENQFEQSRLTVTDSVNMELAGSYQEWLVFKSKPLVLDRTRFLYTLTAKCEDGKATVTMRRIYYFYDEERNPTTYLAEEWITDEYGLKKNKEKLSRVSGRFRKKTIDRKDYLFGKMQALFN